MASDERGHQHHVGDGDGPGQRAQDRQCADDQGEALVHRLRVRREPVELQERGVDLPEWVQEITGVGLEPYDSPKLSPSASASNAIRACSNQGRTSVCTGVILSDPSLSKPPEREIPSAVGFR
jgi:hypothetical protein